MKKFLTPQEIEVHYIIPAIRKELSLELKNLGLDQKNIAEKLGVSEAAISQYISGKRACDICLTTNILKELKISAKRMINNSLFVEELQLLLKLARKERLVCKIGQNKGCAPKNCEACFK